MTPAYVHLLHSSSTSASQRSRLPLNIPFAQLHINRRYSTKMNSLSSAAVSGSTSLPTMPRWTVTRHYDFRKHRRVMKNNDHSALYWKNLRKLAKAAPSDMQQYLYFGCNNWTKMWYSMWVVFDYICIVFSLQYHFVESSCFHIIYHCWLGTFFYINTY